MGLLLSIIQMQLKSASPFTTIHYHTHQLLKRNMWWTYAHYTAIMQLYIQDWETLVPNWNTYKASLLENLNNWKKFRPPLLKSKTPHITALISDDLVSWRSNTKVIFLLFCALLGAIHKGSRQVISKLAPQLTDTVNGCGESAKTPPLGC